MGLTNEYTRYSPLSSFNIITSPNCNAIFVTLNMQEGRFVAVGACEDIIIWDMRLGEKSMVLPGEKYEVTYLAASPDKKLLAGGYSDGSVKLFDLTTGENTATFYGHRAPISTLFFDIDGHRLASGSKDTDIIIWDIVAETGVHRLLGHKGVITQLMFLVEHNILISSSKDSLVKFWDLDTAHCFNTLVGHRTEVWGFTLMKEDRYLVTGSSSSELHVWKLTWNSSENDHKENIDATIDNGEEEVNTYSPLQCKKAGCILRAGRGRVVTLTSDSAGMILVCHGSENSVETFQFVSDESSMEKFKKRQRKLKKKSENSEAQPLESQPTLKDEVIRLPVIKTKSVVKSAHVITGRGTEIRVAISLTNNKLELYSLPSMDKTAEWKSLNNISIPGHQSEVRSVTFSSDNLAIATAANTIKLWNRSSVACLRTITTGKVLSLAFVPGDRHILAGMQNGHLLILDVAVGDILEDVPAHNTELWSICVYPDKRGCVTGGGDATVKFWQFELVTPSEGECKSKVLSVLHKRTLKLEEAVLAVKISPNGALIAAALLDFTVKVFFVDTLKFFISLYGHKMPVLCLDISDDSKLIATGSADRNVKIWGLDFGDCHRSLFAHDDSVTGLQFVPKTHEFFTCGKDGKVKHWDGDKYLKIQTLQGHFGEAWGLAVSPNGNYVVSCGSDRVVRLFECTDSPLVLEDEEEEEREAEENEALATGDSTVIPGHVGLNLPSKKTVGCEKAAEMLLECLDICCAYQVLLEEHAAAKKPAPQVPVLMAAYKVSTIEDFLVEILRRIRSSEMEEALLLLPFTAACDLLKLFPNLLTKGYETELVCRVMMFLLKIHLGPIIATKSLQPIISQLQELSFEKVNQLRDTVGYNYYGLQIMHRDLEARENVRLFRDATLQKKKRDKRKRNKERALKRVIMSL